MGGIRAIEAVRPFCRHEKSDQQEGCKDLRMFQATCGVASGIHNPDGCLLAKSAAPLRLVRMRALPGLQKCLE